jgi:hypothetical protein
MLITQRKGEHNEDITRAQRGPRSHANLLFLLLTVASMLPCGFGRRSLVLAAAALPMPVSEPPPAFARAWPVTETPPVARVAPDACVGCFFIHSVFCACSRSSRRDACGDDREVSAALYIQDGNAADHADAVEVVPTDHLLRDGEGGLLEADVHLLVRVVFQPPGVSWVEVSDRLERPLVSMHQHRTYAKLTFSPRATSCSCRRRDSASTCLASPLSSSSSSASCDSRGSSTISTSCETWPRYWNSVFSSSSSAS